MASRTAGPWRILVALLSALLAAWASPVAIGAAADSSAAAAYAYTYDVLRGVHLASPATVRGPPATPDQDTLYDVAARSRGAWVRAGAASDSPVRKRAWVPVASARGAGFTATTLEHVRRIDGALASIGKSAVAAKSGDDLVDVWRVVGPDEAAQIGKTGSYQVQLGGEGKYFFPTREQAENLGQMYTKQGWGGQQTLTRGQAPRSVIDRAEPVNAGTEGPGWFVRSPDIPSICNVTCVGPVG